MPSVLNLFNVRYDFNFVIVMFGSSWETSISVWKESSAVEGEKSSRSFNMRMINFPVFLFPELGLMVQEKPQFAWAPQMYFTFSRIFNLLNSLAPLAHEVSVEEQQN